MSDTTTTTSAKNLSMVAIRSALPQYFIANTAGLVAAMGNSAANISNLALALVGSALEIAQSGNRPKAWIDTDAKAQNLKGSVKGRVNAALSQVMAVKPASLKSADIAIYEQFASDTLQALTDALTPPVVEKKVSEKETSAQTIARLTAELAAMTVERNALAATLREALATGTLDADAVEKVLAGNPAPF